MCAEAHEEIAISISAARFKSQVSCTGWNNETENSNRRTLGIESLLRRTVLQKLWQLDDGLVREKRTRRGPQSRDERERGEKAKMSSSEPGSERKHERDGR